MSLLFPAEKFKENKELIICDSEEAKLAHRELFSFSDDAYIKTDGTVNIFDAISGVISACNSSPVCPGKIHIVLNWPNLLQISLWKAAKPLTGDVFTLLRNEGIGSQELQPFKNSDINDIFPWLYYGKRFDILKKVCHIAKRKIENNLKGNGQLIRVTCHIIAEDTKKIVASSL